MDQESGSEIDQSGQFKDKKVFFYDFFFTDPITLLLIVI
jgi:hypothetical protein